MRVKITEIESQTSLRMLPQSVLTIPGVVLPVWEVVTDSNNGIALKPLLYLLFSI
jgi:hypothetical protein